MDILFYPGGGAIANRDYSILLSFPLADRQRATLRIEIVEFQIGKFHLLFVGSKN